MKILRVTSSFPEKLEIGKYAGLEPNAYHLSLHQAQQGHEVLLIAPGQPRGPGEEDGFKVMRLPNIRMPRWLLGLKSVIEARRLGFRPDVIHGLNPMPLGWLLNLGRRVLPSSYVFSLHGSYRNATTEFRRLVVFLARRADATVALSPFLARDLVADGINHDRIAAIPSGVDTELFVPSQLPGKPNILFAGSFRGVKRVSLIVRAFSDVRLDVPDCRLTLVGGSPSNQDYSNVMRIVRGLRLGGAVEILKPLSHFEMPRIYNQASVVVLGSRIEGLGKVLLEAGAAGRPSVAPYVGGVPDVIHDGVNGLMYARDDVRGFAEDIRSLVDDPKRSRKMGRTARRMVEKNFSWKRISAMYSDLFERICADERDGMSGGGVENIQNIHLMGAEG